MQVAPPSHEKSSEAKVDKPDLGSKASEVESPTPQAQTTPSPEPIEPKIDNSLEVNQSKEQEKQTKRERSKSEPSLPQPEIQGKEVPRGRFNSESDLSKIPDPKELTAALQKAQSYLPAVGNRPTTTIAQGLDTNKNSQVSI